MNRTPDVVVVGGAGSVGRALRAAAPADWRFHILDRPGAPPVPGAEMLTADATELPLSTAVLLAGNLDNMLTPDGVAAAVHDNTSAAGAFLAAFHERLDHVTLVSSVSVYGKPRGNPMDEGHPIAPTTVYGATKAGAELLATALCDRFGLPLTVLRVTQLFGVPSATATFPHRLVDQLRDGTFPGFHGDPAVVRDYLAVDDLVALLIRIVGDPVPGVFNVGSGRPLTLGEIVELAHRAFGREPPTLRTSAPGAGGGSFSQWMDISRARHELGFTPRNPIEGWFRVMAQRD